jgi:hypothetical protein
VIELNKLFMRITLNKNFVDIDGVEVPGASMSKMLADRLFTSQKGDAVKYLDWALTLHREGYIDLDNSDYQHVNDFIKNNDSFWAGFKGQLLKAFAEAKETSK